MRKQILDALAHDCKLAWWKHGVTSDQAEDIERVIFTEDGKAEITLERGNVKIVELEEILILDKPKDGDKARMA